MQPRVILARAIPILVLGMLVAGAGCSKKPKPVTDVTTTTPPPARDQEVKPPETPKTPEVERLTLRDAFFDYDKYNLRDDARDALENNARLLQQQGGFNVLIEGHADERGTVEYNLALGDRRAQSARSFLLEFGIEPSRISTISYGEERPFVQGHDETAWSQNRRAHFVQK